MEFEKPIAIRLTPGAEPKRFESFELFSVWAGHQLLEWETFGRAWQAHSFRKSMPSPMFRLLFSQETEWRMARDGKLRRARDWSISEAQQFERDINHDLARHELMAVEQPLVERAFALAAIEPEAAGMILVAASNKMAEVIEEFESPAEGVAYAARAVALLSTASVYDAALNDHLAAVEHISAGVRQNDIDRKEMTTAAMHALDDFKASSALVVEGFGEAAAAGLASAEKRLAEIESEWIKLRETYDRMLKLSEPRKYWTDKLEQHQLIFKRWRSAFFTVAMVAALVLAGATTLLVLQGDYFSKSIGAYPWIVPVMLLGAPAFMALWLLRMCGRQWQDHLSRLEDARERVVMVETFLALSRDDASPDSVADPAQLTIILGSIFRAGPGFLSEDGPPAGVIDALLSRVGARP